MNLRQFYDNLKAICEYNDDRLDDVTVGVRNHIVGVVGGTPIIEARNVTLGFDWDNRKLIIDTVKPMRETDMDEVAAIRKKHEEIGWTLLKTKNLKAENKKLLERIKELEVKRV
jgi:hypothetical protein